MANSDRIVVAVTGASGIQYAQTLLRCLGDSGLETHVVFSDAAFDVWRAELNVPFDPARPDMAAFTGSDAKFFLYKNTQVGAPIASGSFRHRGMVICPCTMATLGRVANGTGDGLVGRAAEVTLKEGRKLLLVPRETPYSLIALRNLVAVAEAGATIIDANPGFYGRPQTVQDLVDFVVARVLDHVGVEHDLSKRWGEAMSVQGLFYVFIYVSDFERSKAFYGETLGWKKGTDESDVAGFMFGDAYLIIHRDNRPEGERQLGGGMWMAAKSDDVEAEHAALKAAGIKVGEILSQPWGERQFYFDDPDGYHWSIGQAG